MWRSCVVMLLILKWSSIALCVREHGEYLELMGALKSVSALIAAAFSVNSCEMHDGVTVSSNFPAAFSVSIYEVYGVFTVSSTVSAAFYVNMSDFKKDSLCLHLFLLFLCEYLWHAWRIYCVVCYLCCFLCEYIWRCMEFALYFQVSQRFSQWAFLRYVVDFVSLHLLSLRFSPWIFVALHGGLIVLSIVCLLTKFLTNLNEERHWFCVSLIARLSWRETKQCKLVSNMKRKDINFVSHWRLGYLDGIPSSISL